KIFEIYYCANGSSQFQIVNRIVALSWRQTARVVSNWILFTIMDLHQDSAKTRHRCICVEACFGFAIKVMQNRLGSNSLNELIQGGLELRSPFERNTFASKVDDGLQFVRKVRDHAAHVLKCAHDAFHVSDIF